MIDAELLVYFSAVGPVGADDLGLARAHLEQREVEEAVHHHNGAAGRWTVALLEAEALRIVITHLRCIIHHHRNVADLCHWCTS